MVWKCEGYRHSLASRSIKSRAELPVPNQPAFKIVIMPVSVMGQYTCLHGLVPLNELPHHLRGKMAKNEIWMREDIYNNPEKREAIFWHEKHELDLMLNKGFTYKDAHRQTNFQEARK